MSALSDLAGQTLNLTTAQTAELQTPAGGDAAVSYLTNESTSGPGMVLVEQFFQLPVAGTAISTIANFFGTKSNVSLVASAFYDIEIFAWYTNSADTNTVTWTLTNSAAPTFQNIYFEMSPAAGITAPPGAATGLTGQFLNDTTAARAFTTAALGSAATYFSYFRIWLKNATGGSLQIQATKNVGGTLTPNAGSYWRAARLPSVNVGNFAA